MLRNAFYHLSEKNNLKKGLKEISKFYQKLSLNVRL